MAIEFLCPHCETAVRVPDAAAGRKGKCPQCQAVVRVPTIEIPAATPTAPPEAASSPAVEATDAAEAPGRPEWMSPPAAATEPIPEEPVPDDPSGFVEAPVDGPPDFSAFAVDEPEGEPLIRTETKSAPPPPVDEAPPTEFPSFGGPAPATAPTDSPPTGRKGRRGKRRRKKSRIPVWVIPVVAVVAVGGLYAWITWSSRPKLEGSLEAEAYGYVVLEPKTLDAGTAGMKPAAFEQLVEALEREALRVPSQLMRVDVRGHRGGIQVRVREGTSTRFVRVLKKADPELVRFTKEWKDELSTARLDDVRGAVSALAAHVRKSRGVDIDERDQALLFRVRNGLALNALTLSLGSSVVAVTASAQYRCCYEDADALYFLLPTGVEEFQIVGREFDESGTIFYGTYDVSGMKVIPGERPSNYVDPWFPDDDEPISNPDDAAGRGLNELFGPDDDDPAAMKQDEDDDPTKMEPR